MKRLIDRTTELAFRRMPGALSNFSVIPVLHVERLHQDQAFEQVFAFCTHYLQVSGHRAVATIIPPKTPMLKKMLHDASFSENAYEDRIRKLADVADIGLHGHYMRDADNDSLVHNYWNEREIVVTQMAEEIDWLESRGLMKRRIYSGGWWYCDSMMMDVLVEFGFEYDFSFSTSYFNLGPLSYPGPAGMARFASRNVLDRRKHPVRIWAVSDICSARKSFAVPRYLLRAFFRPWRKRTKLVVSLYGHDWDIDIAAAQAMLEQLKAVGIGLAGLSAIPGQAMFDKGFPSVERM